MDSKKYMIYAIFAISVGLAVIISACGVSTPAEPAGQLAVIDFAEVEVGLGSPTPVSVTIDVSFPTTCSQFSQISQEFVKDGDHTKIMIEVRTRDMDGFCVQEVLPFRMVLPLNAVGMPRGTYSVEVNGVDAGNFEFQN